MIESKNTAVDWWIPDLEPSERGQRLVNHARAIEESTAEMIRRNMASVHVSMYENASTPLLPLAADRSSAGMWNLFERRVWNVCRAVISTMAATITRVRPRPRFLASGGTGQQHRAVKKLQFIVDGIFSENLVYELGRQIAVDDFVMQAGCAEVVDDGDCIRFQRLLPTEVLIDADAGYYGVDNALVVGKKRLIDRRVLLREYGDTDAKKYAITMAPAVNPSGGGQKQMIETFEFWMRGDDEEPGRHTIAIPGNGETALLDKPWPHEWIPIVMLVSDPAITGAWGRSVAEMVAPIQLMIDNLLQRITKSIKVACSPRWWLPGGGKTAPQTISNEAGSFIRGGVSAPQPLTVQALSREPYDMLKWHWESAFELAGVNKMAAAGQHEVGMESGEAVRASVEIQEGRMAVRQARYEAFFVQLAKVTVGVASAMAADGRPIEVRAKVPGVPTLQTFKWSEVNDLDEHNYTIDVWPENILRQTPGGRIDDVTTLVRGGVWEQARGEAALDDLDPEAEFTAHRSAELRIEAQIEGCTIDGKAQQPDDYTNLKMALEMGTQHMNLAQMPNSGVPEKHLELLDDYLTAVKARITALQPAAPPPGMPGMQPTAGAPAPGAEGAAA